MLVISGCLPVPFIFQSLFEQESALLMLQMDNLTPPLRNLLLLNSAYMISFTLLYWVAAAWVMSSKPAGVPLALVLGIITLFRAALMFTVFRTYEAPVPYLAVIASVNGALIVLLSLIAGRIKK